MPSNAQSWVFGANDPELGRGLNHLPYTCFLDEKGKRRIAVGIGACLLDLKAASPLIPQHLREALSETTLNHFMGLGPAAWRELRTVLQFLLSRANRDRKVLEAALVPLHDLPLELPAAVGDYTDFYASRHHALRVGELFRPEKPLLENYDWVPIAYHGRASSLVPSGTVVRRPAGQRLADSSPVFAPTEKLDYELELGFYIGQGNALGEPITIDEAENHLFGVSLLNDWSARDIQAWEYQPLGPFLGKNFCTSVSPWITPMEAVNSLKVRAQPHQNGILHYLQNEHLETVNLNLIVQISTTRSRRAVLAPMQVSQSNSRGLFWTPEQMVTHHTSGGCNLRPGDLLATGTISGERREQAGCLLELTRNGHEPITLPNGERRAFLEDGDEIIFTGWSQTEGQMPIRLGECRGTLLG
jgi:fumarylacetoacetase